MAGAKDTDVSLEALAMSGENCTSYCIFIEDLERKYAETPPHLLDEAKIMKKKKRKFHDFLPSSLRLSLNKTRVRDEPVGYFEDDCEGISASRYALSNEKKKIKKSMLSIKMLVKKIVGKISGMFKMAIKNK